MQGTFTVIGTQNTYSLFFGRRRLLQFQSWRAVVQGEVGECDPKCGRVNDDVGARSNQLIGVS